MMDKIQGAMADAANIEDREEIRALAAAVAGVERDLHEAVADHYEAIGIDRPGELPDAEERVEEFTRLVSAQVSGDLWTFFLDQQAPEDLRNVEAAETHAGKDAEAWQQTVEGWAAALRDDLDAGPETDDRDLADRFTQQRFGVSLDVFEQAVVNYSDARTLRWASRGPIDADIRRIEAATDAITAPDPEGETDETTETTDEAEEET
jgi:hypothetical protein